MVYRRKGFVVINFLITLNVQQRWFLNGIEDGFRGVLDKELVKRLAKVELFCHTTNGESRFTNTHFLKYFLLIIQWRDVKKSKVKSQKSKLHPFITQTHPYLKNSETAVRHHLPCAHL